MIVITLEVLTIPTLRAYAATLLFINYTKVKINEHQLELIKSFDSPIIQKHYSEKKIEQIKYKYSLI